MSGTTTLAEPIVETRAGKVRGIHVDALSRSLSFCGELHMPPIHQRSHPLRQVSHGVCTAARNIVSLARLDTGIGAADILDRLGDAVPELCHIARPGEIEVRVRYDLTGLGGGGERCCCDQGRDNDFQHNGSPMTVSEGGRGIEPGRSALVRLSG